MNRIQHIGWLLWLCYGVILSLVAIGCFASLGALSIDVDDEDSFRVYELIARDFNAFFSSQAQPDGRPVGILVGWLGYELWGNNPAWFHYQSVVIHVLASILLAALCRQMGEDSKTSFLSGLFFMVNVSHFQAMHWLSALDYPLLMLFGSLALTCYLRYLKMGDGGGWLEPSEVFCWRY